VTIIATSVAKSLHIAESFETFFALASAGARAV
jgi:hypothetical protein